MLSGTAGWPGLFSAEQYVLNGLEQFQEAQERY
jgi:hypothetical protein